MLIRGNMLLSNRYIGVTRWFSLTSVAASASMLGACLTKDEYEFEPSARVQRELDYCAVHSACEGQHLTECMREIRVGGEAFGTWPGWYARRDECVGSASSCAEYQQCLTKHTSDGACDPATFQPRCEGDRLVQCASVDGKTEGVEVTGDCTLDGQRCVNGASGGAACGWPVGCDAGCDGRNLFQCADGSEVPRRFECARADQECDSDVLGCVDEKQPRAPCERHHCDGSKLVTCLEGKTQSVDCAAVHPHMTCRMVNGSPQCSVQPGAVDCDSEWDLGTCNGAMARICVASRWVSIDCSRTFGASCVYDDASAGVRCATTPDFIPQDPESAEK